MKSVTFKRPAAPASAEDWVQGTKAQTHIATETRTHTPTDVGTMKPKRLSVDMPAELHHRFKVACTTAHLSMVGEVLDFIERRTAELEGKA